MRSVFHSQLNLGEVDIAKIKLDPKSRDDIPQLLAGLQYIYTHAEAHKAVFKILEEVVPSRAGTDIIGKASSNKGRPGMEQWRILVLGTLRLGLNADYDRIHELANQHCTVRQMLGHGSFDFIICKPSRTIWVCSPKSCLTVSIRKWFAQGTSY